MYALKKQHQALVNSPRRYKKHTPLVIKYITSLRIFNRKINQSSRTHI